MSSSPTDVLIDVTMPQMGVSVAEGTVVEWKKQPGDWVERDEIIASISTDKIDTDVEAPASGRVQEVIVDEANATCAAGAQVAALIAEHGFEDLDGPVVRVATPNVPIPFSPPLEQAVLPSVDRIKEACRELLEY